VCRVNAGAVQTAGVLGQSFVADLSAHAAALPNCMYHTPAGGRY